MSVRDVEKSQKQFLGSTSVNSNLNFESEKVSFKQQNFSKQTPLDIEKYNAIYKIESDPRMENILRKHVSFLKFKPLSPISTSPERVNTSILSTPVDRMQTKSSLTFQKFSKDLKISSKSAIYKKIFPYRTKNSTLRCNYHENIPPSKPCIDCFCKNYYGDEYLDPNAKHVSKIFKRSKIPNFNKPEYELPIDNTEIPVFIYEPVNTHYDLVVSCESHIFSPPSEACDDCIKMNVKKF